ncbi:alpha/beta fold hydrolase [Kitasatospora aureofaciens]|uniref:alpha/beta fold hydrolase n=1 Tax=Kitasatospora aureofaciens TaxID=1894 RepID=UPI001C467298|nr:alpha/beta hydrolase [Kitasatospora aureofaciens]MBV6702652.1 alpha/beta fold hydrolase [Kitasatospora aureofaciens]
MSTFVLVPGFWLGAWAWDEVAAPLRAAGHTVYAVSLPGLAERASEKGDFGLEDHIADLAALLVREDLHDVVLVAHSGACAPVGGVADRMPERIRRVVYLDSGPMIDGGSLYDLWQPDYREAADASVVDGRLPMPSWADIAAHGASIEGLDEAALARIRTRFTPHPAGAYRDRLRLTGAGAGLPQALVSCSFPLSQVHAMIEAGHPWFAGLDGPNWALRELPTGHWPMFSRPADTAAVLVELAAL